MKRSKLLASATRRITAPLAIAKPPLTIPVTMAEGGSARVMVTGQAFVLPDEATAMLAALTALPDKDRAAVLSFDTADTPSRVVSGLLHLMQSAGFTKVSVVTEPAAH